MNKFIKEIINSVPIIAFCGLITSIFLGFTIEFLEWSFKFFDWDFNFGSLYLSCLLYTSPSPRDVEESRMPSSA